MPSYPSTPVAFPTRLPGNPCDPSHWNLMSDEIVAMELALMAPSSETTAPMRPRGLGTAVEWGHGTTGRMCVLGTGYGRCGVIFLHCEPGSTPGTLKTRGTAGAVLTEDIAGTFTLALAPAANADNQTAANAFTVAKNGAVALPTQHRLFLKKTDAQSIPTGAYTDLTWDTDLVRVPQAAGWHSPGAALVIPPVTGVYLVRAAVAMANMVAATNVGMVFNKVSGAAPTGRQIMVFQPPASGTGANALTLVGLVFLTAGDQCTFQVFHNEGAGVACLATWCFCELYRLWL